MTDRRKRILVALINAFCMSTLMSFVMCIINVGFGNHFIEAWLKGWIIAFAVAFPLSYILPPRIQKLVDKF